MRAALVLLLAGCTTGRPLGFSAPKGDHWTIPLVGPLENGLLVTPVYIHGHGPYLFAIDPDAKRSIVDDFVVKDAGLLVSRAKARLLDTGGRETPYSLVAELLDLRVGDLEVQRRYPVIAKTGAYNADGRQIDGVLGHDVIQDSVVFGFDRDAGLVTLTEAAAFHAPADATALPYESIRDDVTVNSESVLRVTDPPQPHSIVKAQVGAQTFAMHVGLGTKLSELREDQWAKAGLSPQPAALAMVDERGVRDQFTSIVQPQRVALAGLQSGPLTLTPQPDDRWAATTQQGILGLNFWQPFDVWADWATRTVFAAPRHAVPARNRIARWAPAACPHLGCVTISVGADGALTVARDPGSPSGALEIELAPAATPDAPTLVANLPAGTPSLTAQVPPAYADATLQVVDESPYPRACPTPAGCIGAMSAGPR
ncbi:MAG TPA: aspartyl protease family protein [Kofleriaceae bacterium]|jgi:hypothetical protein